MNDVVNTRRAQAKQRFAVRNPKSRERWEFAAGAMPGGNTRTVLFFEISLSLPVTDVITQDFVATLHDVIESQPELFEAVRGAEVQ